jgi:hypothetical protein
MTYVTNKFGPGRDLQASQVEIAPTNSFEVGTPYGVWSFLSSRSIRLVDERRLAGDGFCVALGDWGEFLMGEAVLRTWWGGAGWAIVPLEGFLRFIVRLSRILEDLKEKTRNSNHPKCWQTGVKLAKEQDREKNSKRKDREYFLWANSLHIICCQKVANATERFWFYPVPHHPSTIFDRMKMRNQFCNPMKYFHAWISSAPVSMINAHYK